MITGAALLVIALVMRGATVNRYLRSRLAISAALFAAYTAASALIAYGRLPVTTVGQLHTAIPLLMAFGIANALVVMAINPWRADRIPEHFPNIVQDAIVIALFGVAAMLFLPDKVVTTTAVGAVVIGFALQDTLGNLFAGLAIQIEKPFRVGHWVTIGGKDGLVSEITWRATKIRTKAGNFVVVPNSVLSRDTITNYSEPTRETRLEVMVGAGYDAPPNEVKALSSPRCAAKRRFCDDPPPEVLLADFADSAINYRVRVWTIEFDDGRARPRSGALARLLRVPSRGHRVSLSGAGQHRIAAAPRTRSRPRTLERARRRRDSGLAQRLAARPARGDVAAPAVRRRRNDRARRRRRRVDVRAAAAAKRR